MVVGGAVVGAVARLADAAAALLLAFGALWAYLRGLEVAAARARARGHPAGQLAARLRGAVGGRGRGSGGGSPRRLVWVELRGANDLVQRSLGAGVPDPFAVLELVKGGPPGQRRCASVLAATTSPRWGGTPAGRLAGVEGAVSGASGASGDTSHLAKVSASPQLPPPQGERFAFAVDSLPATVAVSLHDWNLFGACELLGRAEIVLEPADGGRLRADRARVVKARALQGVPRGTLTFAQCVTSRAAAADPADLSPSARRRQLEEGLCRAARGPGPKPGSPGGGGCGRGSRGATPERFVEDFSCAIVAPGDGKLRPGRMYLWEHGLIFQSSASLGALLHVPGAKRRGAERVSLEVPFADVDHVRPSSHAVLNAALSVALRTGADGGALGEWASRSAKTGALKLKFASFWQRGRTQKVLQRLLDRSRAATAEATAAVSAGLAPGTFSGGGTGLLRGRPEEREALAEAPFPLNPQQFWDRFWADDSTFPHDFARTCGDQDCFVGLWKWRPAGMVEGGEGGGAAASAGGGGLGGGGTERELHYRAAAVGHNNPLTGGGPVLVRERQRFSALRDGAEAAAGEGEPGIRIETALEVADEVPLADGVVLESDWTVAAISEGACLVSITMGVRFPEGPGGCPFPGKATAGALVEGRRRALRWFELALQTIR